MKKYIPHVLLAGYVALFIWGAIEPFSRTTWWVENTPIFLIALTLTILYIRNVHFSPLSYFLMAFLLYWHTVGGHFTFERVPFDWFDNLFGFKRNMFDRVGHFSVGFYAFPIIEYLRSRNKMSLALACSYAIFAIAFVAMSYELIEWIYAATSDPTSGAAFLGSQGDVWDAQKDMLMDTLGALATTVGYLLVRSA